MKRKPRRRWIWLLIAAAVALAVWLLPQLILPPPTSLVVAAVDAAAGAPLPGALVQIVMPGAPTPPAMVTDARGVVRFQDLPPAAVATVRIQKIDYDLALQAGVILSAGGETWLTVPLTPHAGDRLFVGLDQSRVAEIDLASFQVIQTQRLPGNGSSPVHHLLAHPQGDRLYAVAGSRGHILDPATGASRGRLEILDPWDLAYSVQGLGLSADGQRLFAVTNWVQGVVMVLDATSGQLLDSTRQIHLDPTLRAEGGAAGTPAEATGIRAEVSRALLSRLHVAHRNVIVRKPGSPGLYLVRRTLVDPQVAPLDAALDEVLAGLPVGFYPQATLSADETAFYHWGLGYFGTDVPLGTTLYRQRLGAGAPRARSQSQPLGTVAMAASPHRDQLYVLNAVLGTLTILDPMADEPPVLVPVGKQPVALALDATGEWAYVANQTSHTVSVVDLLSARVMESIPLPGEPFSVALWQAPAAP